MNLRKDMKLRKLRIKSENFSDDPREKTMSVRSDSMKYISLIHLLLFYKDNKYLLLVERLLCHVHLSSASKMPT